MTTSFLRLLIIACVAALSLPTLAHAQGAAPAQPFPTKPVRVIVPFSAGSAIDVNARLIGAKLADKWGQQVVVDNRVGANSIIGMEAGARAAPDGYTIVMGNDAALAVNPALQPKLPYDPLKDFSPITLIGSNSVLLVVHPSVPVQNVKELIAHARDRKGDLNYGSGGNGSAQHVAMEMFAAMTGARMTHVPYKGVIPAMNDVIAGQIPVMFVGTPGALPHVRAGKLRALAIGSSKRSAVAPDVPTVEEAGVPGYGYAAWVGYLAPAGTPAPIVAKINADIIEALNVADVRDRLNAVGFEIQTGTPEAFQRIIARDIERFGKLMRDAGVKPGA